RGLRLALVVSRLPETLRPVTPPRASDPSSPLALVMSGGGARAAYQVGVLRAVARRCPEFRPRIITGVSAGAINAASLASFEGSFSDALDNLGALWEGLTTEDVL